MKRWQATSLLLATLCSTAQAAEPDAAAGKVIFAKRCSGCHSLDADKEGPRLRGVFGRKAGSAPGYLYSDGLRNSPIIWDKTSMEKWLENPNAVVRDNDMEFRVANPEERRALVAYLSSVTLH